MEERPADPVDLPVCVHEPVPAAPTVVPARWWQLRPGFVALLAVAFGVAGAFAATTGSPFVTAGPGPVLPVQVAGVELNGTVDVLTVEVRQLSWWDYGRAWLAGERPAPAMEGGALAEQRAIASAQMTESQRTAAAAAVVATGGTVDPAVRIVDVRAGSTAEAAGLGTTDRIVAVDGVPVAADDLSAAVQDRTVVLTVVTVDGTSRQVEVTVGSSLGVQIVDSTVTAVELEADLSGVGGSSAGLALAVAFTDTLAADDLLAGRHVAATGTITVAGRVGPIGGIADKVAAAVDAGVDVILVPGVQEQAAAAAAAGRVEIVAVADLDDALSWLCGSAWSAGGCTR